MTADGDCQVCGDGPCNCDYCYWRKRRDEDWDNWCTPIF